ncbi:MAG: TonB family protein [Acidobacteriota bacterium]
MFESSVVESKVQTPNRRRFTVLPLSIAAHVAVIGGTVFASIWHVELPTQSPSQITYPVMNPPAPQLPQPTPPPAAPRAPAQPAPAHSTPATAPALEPVPTTVPESIPVVAPGPDNPPEIGAPGEVTPDTPGALPGSGHENSQPGPGNEISGPRHVGNGVTAPRVLQRVDPRYPNILLKTGMAGTVVLQCVVDTSGRIESVSVLTSPNKLFEQSAIEAVRQWRFKPGSFEGRPVATIFELTVHFQSKR